MISLQKVTGTERCKCINLFTKIAKKLPEKKQTR